MKHLINIIKFIFRIKDKEEVVELIIEFKKDLYRDVINTFNQFLINTN